MTSELVDPDNLDVGPHDDEPHNQSFANRLNWLRAAVLGANDGIVSTAGIVMGVAGATSSRSTILIAGTAGLVAGALSMAAGEYVSVSTQRDSEQALLDKERRELIEEPEEELAELAGIYVGKGLSERLALEVAHELTAHDALGAHAEAELGIDPDELTNPWHAAGASMLAFTIGALLPLLTIAFSPSSARVLGHRVHGRRRTGPHRLDQRPPRLRTCRTGRGPQHGRRVVRDARHLRRRLVARYPDRLTSDAGGYLRGAGPVERRTTSSGLKRYSWCGIGAPSIASVNADTAASASACTGCRTVVRGGRGTARAGSRRTR